jgi:WD40 repeat protein
VALSTDGKRVLTGGDNIAILWDADHSLPVQTFARHTDTVMSVALRADGKRALTGSADKTAILWDADTGKPIHIFKDHKALVNAVALSADGRRALTGAWDKTAILWETDTGKSIRTFKAHAEELSAVAFSGDGKRVLTGSWDKTAKLWDVESGNVIRTFQGHTDRVLAIAWSKDGRRILTGSKDHTAILWDADNGAKLVIFPNHDGEAESVAISAGGKRALTMATVIGTGKVGILWDTDPAKYLKTFQHLNHQSASAAVFGKDSTQLLVGYEQPIGTFQGRTATVLWDVDSAKPVRTFEAHASPIASLTLSRDGQRIFVSYEDSAMVLWDAQNGKPLRSLKSAGDEFFFKSYSFVTEKKSPMSKDGKRILTPARSKTAMLWDADTANVVQTFPGDGNDVNALALGGDGTRVLSGSAKNTATLWDAATGKPVQTFEGHTARVLAVALSADGKRALTGSQDNTAILWDAETGKSVHVLKGSEKPGFLTPGTAYVAFSADDKRIITIEFEKLKPILVVWDAETAQVLQRTKFDEGLPYSLRSFSVSDDGKLLLTASKSTAGLADTKTGRLIQLFPVGLNGEVTSVAFGPGNACVVTASTDGVVRIWKPGRQEPVFSFLRVAAEWVFWTPEGYYTCSANGESLIAWKVADDSPQGYRIIGPEQLRKTFYRPELFRHLLAELDVTKALAKVERRPVETLTLPDALPPVVVIARPLKSREIINSEECEISAKAVPYGDNAVASMQLLLDGQPYDRGRGKRTFDPSVTGAVIATWKVKLPGGKNLLQVIAEGRKGGISRPEQAQTEIIREDEAEAPPTLLLLSVGVSDYKIAEPKGTEYAGKDAERFLQAQLKYGQTLYKEVEQIALTDGKAAKVDILDAFDQLLKKARKAKNPVTMIFLAGHGETEADGDWYFLAADSNPTKLLTTAISSTELIRFMTKIPGKVVVFLDACHAGAFAGDMLFKVKAIENGGHVAMICSSSAEEQSLQDNGQRGGKFTLALAEGLAGDKTKDKNGEVHLLALFAYLRLRVQEITGGRQRPCANDAAVNRFDMPLTKP